MPLSKTPKRYYNIRIDEQTYEAIRKIAFKSRAKIITVVRDNFLGKQK